MLFKLHPVSLYPLKKFINASYSTFPILSCPPDFLHPVIASPFRFSCSFLILPHTRSRNVAWDLSLHHPPGEGGVTNLHPHILQEVLPQLHFLHLLLNHCPMGASIVRSQSERARSVVLLLGSNLFSWFFKSKCRIWPLLSQLTFLSTWNSNPSLCLGSCHWQRSFPTVQVSSYVYSSLSCTLP